MKNYNFINKQKIAYIVVAVVLVIGILSVIIRGFNLDIDFAGGVEMAINVNTPANDDVFNRAKTVTSDVIGKDRFSSVGRSGTDENEIILKTNNITEDEKTSLLKALIKEFDLTDDTIFSSYSAVGASMSKSTTRVAFLSSFAAILLMLVYITIRFQFTSGLSAIICLAFNIYAMLTLYSLLRIPINSNVIAACLTILGYSINATIIIFDRVRENVKKNQSKDFSESVNLGIHQTFFRSVFTTLTTLLTIGMVYILGVDSIKNFALPLIMGIIAGLFSSVFLSGPIWNSLNKHISFGSKQKTKKVKAK